MNKLQNVMMKMPDINAVNTETEATTLASSSFFFSQQSGDKYSTAYTESQSDPVNINAKGKTMETAAIGIVPK